MTEEEIATQVFCVLISGADASYRIDRNCEATLVRAKEVAKQIKGAFPSNVQSKSKGKESK